MADTELDEITANLYVDFLQRRGCADFLKEAPLKGHQLLGQVEEADEEEELKEHLDFEQLHGQTPIQQRSSKVSRIGNGSEPTLIRSDGTKKPLQVNSEGHPLPIAVSPINPQLSFRNDNKAIKIKENNSQSKKWNNVAVFSRPEKDLDVVRSHQIKVKALQSEVDRSRLAFKVKEIKSKAIKNLPSQDEEKHPLNIFVTSEPVLLSTPFDYDAALQEQLSQLHNTSAIESRINDIDSKLADLHKQRHLPIVIPDEEDQGWQSKMPEEADLVRKWQRDRKLREERLKARLAKQEAKKEALLKEELEKNTEEEQLKRKIRAANSESKLHSMNQNRILRAQVHQYQSKVVNELIRHPRTYYFYKASEEAIEKVRCKLKSKFESHKVKLGEQKDRLEAIERQFTKNT